LNPSSVDFGDHEVGTGSAGVPVTITNSGDTDLVITGVALAGAGAGHFSLAGPVCVTTLAPGARCTEGVAFAPTTPGPHAATLAFTDNGPGSPQAVELSGNGLAPPTTT